MRRRHKTRATIERKEPGATVWRIESASLGTYWATVIDESGEIALTTGVRKQPVSASKRKAIIHRVREAIAKAQTSAS
jgi:hypothetical protein